MHNSGFRLSFLVACIFPTLCFGTDPPKATPDYSKEAFVTERSLDKIKFENNGTYTREISARVKIQSDAGIEHFSVVKFAFQSSLEAFTVDYVRVIQADGSTVVTPADTFQDMPSDVSRAAPFYSDEHEMQIAVKGLGVGDVLEYQAHWQHDKPLIPGQFWWSHNFARKGIVLQETLEVTSPHGRALKLKSKANAVISHTASYDVYTWTSSNLADKDDKAEKAEQQELIWQMVRGRQSRHDIDFSTFQNFQELGDWYRKLQSDRVQPTAEVQAKAAAITKDLTDQDAKIRALYDFVSTKYRYIGIAFGVGRYQPHTSGEVLANQYGDCKDKHTLFASLLSAAGIKAYPALISSTSEIDADVPSPGQFDHVITAIPVKSGYLWLDTTSEVAPFGLLLSPLRDKHALVMPDDKPAELALTPADDPFPTLQKFEMRAKLNDTGVLEGKAESTDRGDKEVMFRAAFRMVPLPRWKDLVQRVSYGLGFAGDVSDVTASPPEKTAEPFRFSYSYKRKDYSDWGNRRVTPPLPQITLPAVDDDIPPTAPIWLGSPGAIDFHATLELPKGYTPELAKAVHVKRDFADYDATYSYAAGVITAERLLTLKLREVPAAEYKEYKSFRKAVEDDYETYTSLSSGSSTAAPKSYQNEIWALPKSENAEAARLYDDASEQANRNDTAAEIASLKRALEIDPKFVRAWLWLGEIYKWQRQSDLALAAYRKAIEIDPEQPVGYKALSQTLLETGKWTDAIPVLQQLVKVAPDQAYGFNSLGATLVALKRYREAIDPLVTWAKLAPEQAGAYRLLGEVYTKLEDPASARAQYQKALALDTGQQMLNTVAYDLAEQKVDLDQAREYAIKAVTQAEDESAKTDLSNLQLGDLVHPPELAAFWDTLGWVYFQLNDLPKAESYLNAAWVLSQDPVVGEHLGHVYEKENKLQQAIRAYQLAEAASPPVLTTVAGTGNAPLFNRNPGTAAEDLRRLGAVPGARTMLSDLNDLRSIKLPRLVVGTANAEFFVLFSPGGKIEAKFISGSDSLKGADISLRASKFKVVFPDEHVTRILRRGILGCFPYSGCTFVMFPPNSVGSIQ